MNTRQINWARQHDWFLNEENGEVFVRDDMTIDGILSFESIHALILWAGY